MTNGGDAWSPLHLPGCAGGAVFQHDAFGQKLVTDAIGFLEVPRLPGSVTGLNFLLHSGCYFITHIEIRLILIPVEIQKVKNCLETRAILPIGKWSFVESVNHRHRGWGI